ncbi:O-antigen ligase family protein [Paenibacillus sp. YYML68]|uniref:O-antigen ligase family protein n=1 Tax=Paenibacillus sp. YYML68 TaxID=2909250 RepID=UPI002493C64B|nr:O-antigen ligase family protein [Paenibacillus sp. YYML68]
MHNAFNNRSIGIPISILTLIVFLTPMSTQVTGVSLLKLIEDGAYFLMFLYSAYTLKRNNDIIHIPKTVMLLLFFLLGYAVLGYYYSGIGVVILQFREFKYLLLLVILIPFTKREDFKYVWPILNVVAIVCIPVSIVQWFIFQSSGDFITGIMGERQSGTMSLFLMIVFFSEFTRRLVGGQRVLGLYFLYLVPTALNESKITLFLLPVLIVLSLIMSKKFKLKYMLVVGIFLALFFTGYSMMFDATGYKKGFDEMFSYEGLKEYMLEDGEGWGKDAGRLTKLLMAFDLIEDSPYFGYGLGASYGGATSGLAGYIFATNNSGVKLGGTRQQVVLSLIDTGIIGASFAVLLLLVVFMKVVAVRKMSLEKIIAVHTSFIILITFLYQQIFYSYQLMFMLIMFTVLCLRTKEHERSGSNATLIRTGSHSYRESM